MRTPRKQRRLWTWIGLAAWFGVMVATSAILLGRHLVPLPRPTRDDAALASALDALRPPSAAPAWHAVHVLYASCRCSQRIADHLAASARPTDVRETVLLVGEDADLESRLRARRFEVVTASEDELAARWHVQAVPLFVVIGPDGLVRYAGGYTTRKQGPEPQDLVILARARAEREIDALPIYGCAVAAELREKLDPTGLF